MLLAVLILIFAAVVIFAAYKMDAAQQGQTDNIKKETIRLWYTDDALTDYLSSKVLEFYNQTDIRIETKLVSGLEYLEAINSASLNEDEEMPDVYIIGNDSLEKAYLSGLAVELDESVPIYDPSAYNQAAKKCGHIRQ